VIYPHCFIGHNAVLGNQNFVLGGSIINHDVCLENNVTLCSGVTLAGFVHVETGCYLGQACTIKQYLRIGKGSLIGMGSVVVHDVPPNSVMVGNPARRLCEREA
jgi:acyl-[acyl carrier protein]--UDP-N-acetylglucosamine O-acyltransferase